MLPKLKDAVDGAQSVEGSSEHPLEIFIPFTTLDNTQRSMEHAEWLCSGLNARIRLIRIQPIPYPRDLDRPAVADCAIRAELAKLHSALPVSAEIWLCRDWVPGLLKALPPSSLVILTYRRKLFPAREQKLGRILKTAGHRVSMFLEEKSRV